VYVQNILQVIKPENEMGEVCGMNERKERCIQSCGGGENKGKET
jgi:hypothetical protein